MTSSELSVALVHDWLNQYGGAERVLERLVQVYSRAPIYTSMYWRSRMPDAYRTWDIRTTWMDHLPGVYRFHQAFFPLYAFAFNRLDLSGSGYDLILSNKSGFCHGVQTGGIPHLCYCLAPTRYVWEYEQYAAREHLPASVKLLLKPIIRRLRRWDYEVAQRPTTHYVAISTEIQRRIRRYYARDAEVIFPPVDVGRFYAVDEHDDYYLIVSRLVPYKRIDLAVHAFTQLGLPLKIVGDGRDREALEADAGANVSFLGWVPDADLPSLVARCRAFIFPGREDFGLAPVEAQAAGRPVIAYRAGGALDTVVEGVTGAFFDEPTSESLMEAVKGFDPDAVSPDVCRSNAERFDFNRFQSQLKQTIKQLV